MSEEKKVRDLQAIQQDYQTLCVKAGHVQYQIHALEKDLDLMNDELRALNLEAAELQAKVAKEKQQEA